MSYQYSDGTDSTGTFTLRSSINYGTASDDITGGHVTYSFINSDPPVYTIVHTGEIGEISIGFNPPKLPAPKVTRKELKEVFGF